MPCGSLINLSENSIEGTEKKLEVFWGGVHKFFGELIMKGAKPGDSINKIRSHKSIMNQFNLFISPSIKLWNSCYCPIKEENYSGVLENEFNCWLIKCISRHSLQKAPKRHPLFVCIMSYLFCGSHKNLML